MEHVHKTIPHPSSESQGRKNLSGRPRVLSSEAVLKVKPHFPLGGGEMAGIQKKNLLEDPCTTKLVFAFGVTLQTSFKVDEPQETKGGIRFLSKLSCLRR